MIDDMRGGRVASSAAKPLAASQAPNHGAGIVNAAITTRGFFVSISSLKYTISMETVLTRKRVVAIPSPHLAVLSVSHSPHPQAY